MSSESSESQNPLKTVSVAVVGQFSWGLMIVFVLASACWLLLPYTGYLFAALVFLMVIVLAGTRWNRGPVLAMGVGADPNRLSARIKRWKGLVLSYVLKNQARTAVVRSRTQIAAGGGYRRSPRHT